MLHGPHKRPSQRPKTQCAQPSAGGSARQPLFASLALAQWHDGPTSGHTHEVHQARTQQWPPPRAAAAHAADRSGPGFSTGASPAPPVDLVHRQVLGGLSSASLLPQCFSKRPAGGEVDIERRCVGGCRGRSSRRPAASSSWTWACPRSLDGCDPSAVHGAAGSAGELL